MKEDEPNRTPTATAQPVATDPAEQEKLSLEVVKLKEEIKRLSSENSRWGTITRISWPLVSGILTIAVSLIALNVSWQTQSFTANQERSKKFVSALQMATDAKAGQDARIAGIWTLADYWHYTEYSGIAANTLAAILATDADDPSTANAEIKVQRLRMAAADVVGKASDENTMHDEGVRLRKLLFGDAPAGQLGAITRYQQELRAREDFLLSNKPVAEISAYYTVDPMTKKSTFHEAEPIDPKLKASREALWWQDRQTVDLKLQATREAIRKNWAILESATFASHDLREIKLYKARAHGAYFGKAVLMDANLCGADLSGATFSDADLSGANLAGADLAGSLGWSTAKLDGANIHNVKNAPKEFKVSASNARTVDLAWPEWQKQHGS